MNKLTRPLVPLVLALASLALLVGCDESVEPEIDDPSEVAEAYFDTDYGKPLFEKAPAPGKEDSANGRSGLPTSVDRTETAVWEVRNQWADTDTEEARQAGLAWDEDSGLTWDQKYAAWVESMPRIDAHETYYDTFTLTTPWGKEIQAPLLECAEASIFLRVTFASWYGLPFYMEAVDGNRERVYFGHFGARTANGRYRGTPRYKVHYRDYTELGTDAVNDWPTDEKLRTLGIYGSSSRAQPFLGPDAKAGAYFDEIYLNKRVGHFLVLFLSYFGSVNLADSNNTFNLVPHAIQPGDTLLERWQKRGIGHTLVVKHVEERMDGGLEVNLVGGSMPRRQPKWEDGVASKRAFTLAKSGGVGENSDGDEYWKLGGGLKRWRTAKIAGTKWRNVVPDEYKEFWIPNYDKDGISGRPAIFEMILGEVPPELKQDAIAAIVEDNRNHLRQYPASCSARIRREAAFDELYTFNESEFGLDKEETDREFRTLEDYVFAELVYEDSKTCCWNSTTSAMYEIVMDYNRKHVTDTANGMCNEPVVFMNRDGGYEVFREHAVSLGREAEWVAWSEDESCPQRGVTNDTIEEGLAADFCTIADALNTPQP